MVPAIFLDRDGVIIENRPNYVRSWDEVEIFPQALAALAGVSHSPYKIVIITNQAGVGRGLIPIQVVEDINRRLVEAIENAGGRVDGVFVCPHKPEDGCECRKPRPGLLRQAAQALSLDISQSILIGDNLSDIQAGLAIGVRQVALVRTGLGAQQLHSPLFATLPPFPVYNTLADALANLISVVR
ncbi:MAG TPA: HAD family hydrolase [Anaerolineales bacterium]